MRVLLLGDSHLAIFGAKPRLIARDCTVRAVAGACASDIADQWSDVDPADFDVIAVSVGTNDCLVRPASLEEFLGGIQSVIDRAGTTPVLMVDNPGADGRTSEADIAKLKLYAEEAARLVESVGGRSLNTPAVMAPLGHRGRSADGIHVGKVGLLLFIPALRLALRRARSAARRSRVS